MGFIMVLGVLVMGLAAINCIPLFLTKTLEWSIYFMNTIINKIASIEEFIIRDIPFNTQLLLSSYLLIICTIIWFKKPHFNRLIFILFSIILLQITFIQNNWEVNNQQEWIVFNSKKNTLITGRMGKEVTLYTNNKSLNTASKNILLNAYLVGNFSSLKHKKTIRNLSFFKGNKILILDSLGIYPKNSNPDILILTQSPKINLDRLFETIKPKIVVADASNYKTVQKLWKTSCLKQKIPFHATSEKGFYILN